jgi:flagellar biosynthesis protein FliR
MGLGFGAQAGTGSGSPVVSQLVRLVALAALVGTGGHRQIIAWLYGSLRAFPVGAELDFARLTQTCIGYGLLSVALAVRVAFPIVAASLLGHAAMAIASRAAPQVNLQSIGFSTSILAGGSALYFAAPLIAQGVANATMQALAP